MGLVRLFDILHMADEVLVDGYCVDAWREKNFVHLFSLVDLEDTTVCFENQEVEWPLGKRLTAQDTEGKSRVLDLHVVIPLEPEMFRRNDEGTLGLVISTVLNL